MRAKGFLVALIFSCASVFSANAQNSIRMSYEYGGCLGIANYYGDLASHIADVPATTGPAAGLFARMNYGKWLSLSVGVDYGHTGAADRNSINKYQRKRNLSFKTNASDVNLTADFNFLTLNSRSKYKTILYVFAGWGLFHFNPYTTYNGKKVYLQPVGTEGEGAPQYPTYKPYALTQGYVPFGFGLKQQVGPNWIYGLEIRPNKIFTDYFDDVSTAYPPQSVFIANGNTLGAALSDRAPEIGLPPSIAAGNTRGNPKYQDWYFLTYFTITYNFTANRPNFYKF